MGHGRWDSSAYTARTSKKLRDSGTVFTHNADVKAGRKSSVHPNMDPKRKATDKSPNKGMAVREAYDVPGEHNQSRPVAVVFDVTGSMQTAPMTLQKKLPALFGLVLRKGYITDPQFLFGAIGDEYSDRYPIQAGQFESDNRSDEDLENLVLEGGGGGGNHESYATMAYFLAFHTDLDSVKKRNEKGYAFFIGDERPYAKVTKENIEATVGLDYWPDPELKEMTSKEVFDKLQEKFEVFFLFCSNISYSYKETIENQYSNSFGNAAVGWKDVLPLERIKTLENVDAVSETIAGIIGLTEGTVGYDDAMADLDETSDDKAAVLSASKVLATVGAGSAITTGEEELPDLGGEPGAETL